MYKNPFEDQLVNNSTILNIGNTEELTIGESSVNLMVTSELTNDQLGLYKINLAPHTTGAILHYHRYMDETFIILEGTVDIILGSETEQYEQGTVIHVPRFTPHGFKNNSDKYCKILLIFNPAMKREGFFRELTEILNNEKINESKFDKLYQKYDSHPLEKF